MLVIAENLADELGVDLVVLVQVALSKVKEDEQDAEFYLPLNSEVLVDSTFALELALEL